MEKVLQVSVSGRRSYGRHGPFEPELARVRLNDDGTVSLMVYGPRPPYLPPILLTLDVRSWRRLMGRLDEFVRFTV
jgi:hypothetical protein